MRVERLLYPITSLGPGDRIALWTAGCTKQCRNCENPELWESRSDQEISPQVLAATVLKIHEVYGTRAITITGGDPLEQYEELELFLTQTRPQFDDILLYTGFTLAEVEAALGASNVERLKSLVDVIVDGRYDDSKNDGVSALRGSTNQRIVFFSERLKEPYEAYMNQGRTIQNIAYRGRVVSVGIHNRDLDAEFDHE